MNNDNDKISEAFLEIEKLKLSMARVMGHLDSEQGTLQREANRIRAQINSVEEKFHKIIFDSETGLIIKLDRLSQESLERKRHKQNIIALWIGVGVLIADKIFSVITKK